MAKKKPPLYLKSQGQWRRDFIRKIRAADIAGADLQAATLEGKLLREETYLKDAVKELRRYVKGFGASDGYDLNRVAYWLPARIQRVKRDIAIIRQETARGRVDDKGNFEPLYRIVRPRSKASREALERFTGETHVPGRKAYFVGITDPRQKVSLVPKTVTVKDKKGRKYKAKQIAIEVTQTRGKMKIYERYFRFPEPPLTFDDVIIMTRKMLRFMPKGYYVIETSNHGAIAAPIPKGSLLSALQDRFLPYDVVQTDQRDNRGLAETVIGYRLVGMHSEDAHREYSERLNNRERMRRFRLAQRAKRRARVMQQLKRRPFG